MQVNLIKNFPNLHCSHLEDITDQNFLVHLVNYLIAPNN